MGLMIDTSALVSLEREDKDWTELMASYASESVAIPVIVWAEALVGVRMAKSAQRAAKRRAKLEQLRLHVPIIEFDATIAEHYADIFMECAKAGTMIPQNDMAVAATARSCGYSVLVSSRDEAHFGLVRNLKVVML